ncbi:MAG: hypothetical protein K2X32_01055 [Phycisphaerales bacterium]|nr:hypothetical protein [Phycisphaerales bacterium]
MSAIGERIRDKMEDWGLDKYFKGGGGGGGADSGQRTKLIVGIVALALAVIVIGWQLLPSGLGGSAASVATPTLNWVDNARQKLFEAGTTTEKRFARVSIDIVNTGGKDEVLVYGKIPNAAAEAPLKDFITKLSPPFTVRYQLEIDGQKR